MSRQEEIDTCTDCVPEAPFDFEGLTGCLCVKHNGGCMHIWSPGLHNPGCPDVKAEEKP